MEFEALANLCEVLSATTKRTSMTNLAAEFFRELDDSELEPAVSMILGRALPKINPRTLDVSWVTLSGIIRHSTKIRWEEFSADFRNTGDIGTTTKIAFEKSRTLKQSTLSGKPLTILEVRRIFEAIAESGGFGSRGKKERLITTLLSRAKPVEAKYLVKILIGEMRTGFQEGLMELALSKAFSIPLRKIQTATMLTGDVGEVAVLSRRRGKEGIMNLGFKLFVPIKPMLAQMAENPIEAIREFGGATAFEFKFDGVRVQIHKSNSRVRIFSRRLTEVTNSLPEIVELAIREVKSQKAILEGEVIAQRKDGKPLPFQHLMRRFRRIHEIDKMVQDIPTRIYLFDAIYVDNENLIEYPYVERREKLMKISGGIPLAEQLVTNDPKEAELFLREAVDMGHEGLMAKRLDGTYTPGVRGKNWLKIKETLEPLDLVIVAAEYGYGRRHNWLSDYYLGARDEHTGDFLIVGKTFKGLTDEEIEDITERLKKLVISEEGNRVQVRPKIVVEIAYNEIQKSPKYKSEMALRFARISRIRDDKTPEEADTIRKVRSLYEGQFQKKSTY